MRILAASDLHGNQTAYEWLAQRALERRVQIVILAGDLLGCPDGYETVEAAQRQDAQVVVQILSAMQTPIYYIMGNDDFVDLNPASNCWRFFSSSMKSSVGWPFSVPREYSILWRLR